MPLLLALQAAGVPVRAVRPYADATTGADIEVEDATDDAAVAAVVAAHDPAALDAAAAQARADEANDRQAARLAVAVLLSDAARLEDPAQALTAQVVRNHLARTDRALAAVLRQLGRLGAV